MQPAEIKNRLRAPLFRWMNRGKPAYRCPLCGYHGPFVDKLSRKAIRSRRSAKCPGCGSMERHRFQFMLLEQALDGRDPGQLALLHIAPEPSLANRLQARFGRYLSADLLRTSVDCRLDVQALPFADGSWDVVLNSHVLQYVPDDRRALAEIHRILRSGGIALLPVPLIHERTVERTVPDPVLNMPHEPGPDYYDRYREVFERVELFDSRQFDDRFHLFREPISDHPAPLRIASGRVADLIPVCHRDG